MMEIPSSEWVAKPPSVEEAAPVDTAWRRLPGVVTHTFTHFHLELTVWAAEVNSATLPDARFVARRDLHAEALPTVMRKIIAHVLGDA